jgi:hypothetical protein
MTLIIDNILTLLINTINNFSQELVDTTTEQLQNLTDILSEDIAYPHVWCDFEASGGGHKMMERIKFTILEIQVNKKKNHTFSLQNIP